MSSWVPTEVPRCRWAAKARRLERENIHERGEADNINGKFNRRLALPVSSDARRVSRVREVNFFDLPNLKSLASF